jgi:hypothetical protein
MISTGDTAFVLKQHTSRTASASGLRRRASGLPSPCVTTPLSSPYPALARAMACAHGLKG